MHPDADHLASLKMFTKMPSAPPLWRRIDAVRGDDPGAPEQLAAIIRADPVLAVEFVRASLGHASFTPCDPEIREAVHSGGITASRRLTLALLAKHCLMGWARPGSQLDRPTWWRHSFGTAVAAAHIATMVKGVRPGACYSAGLFHDSGILAVDWLAPQLLGSIGVPGDADPEWDREDPGLESGRILDVAHVEFGRALAANWKVPESALEGVFRHHAPRVAKEEHRAVACVVCVADVLMSPPGAWWYGGGPEEEYRNALLHLRLDEFRLARVRDRVESDLERHSEVLTSRARH